MWRRLTQIPLVALLCLGLSSLFVASAEEERVRVTVEFETLAEEDAYWLEAQQQFENEAGSDGGDTRRRWLEEELPARKVYRYQHGKAIAMSVPESKVGEMLGDGRFKDVEVDTKMYMYQQGQEFLPYGVAAVQATTDAIPPPAYPSGNCSDPSSFKVCVVDSGLLLSHDDIPYNETSASILGSEFGLDSQLNWFDPSPGSSHGTHVTGTIVAKRGNGQGVQGVVSDAEEGICLLISRVFDASGVQSSSIVMEGVEWCADNGANIINLSLGSANRITNADRDAYKELYEEDGILIVAAAGNSGSSEFSFPASLNSVISVGATDVDDERARFSQFNSQISLMAPGVDILSTISANGLFISSNANIRLSNELMEYSRDILDEMLSQEFEVFDCGLGDETCEGAEGKACLIERGSITFKEKAKNCEDGNGAIALIYNDQGGLFGGSLGKDSDVEIPVFALSNQGGRLIQQERGNALANAVPVTISIRESAGSYGFLDGTSMAAPHVTGVAAMIWAARPECTNEQIREALEQSALDLGPSGKDVEYGYGLVQAEAAYEYILSEFETPCGNQIDKLVLDVQEEQVRNTIESLLAQFGF